MTDPNAIANDIRRRWIDGGGTNRLLMALIVEAIEEERYGERTEESHAEARELERQGHPAEDGQGSGRRDG